MSSTSTGKTLTQTTRPLLTGTYYYCVLLIAIYYHSLLLTTTWVVMMMPTKEELSVCRLNRRNVFYAPVMVLADTA